MCEGAFPARRLCAAAPWQEAVLTLLDRVEEGMPLQEIVTSLGTGTSKRQVLRTLADLRNQGLARSYGRGMGSPVETSAI